MMVLNRISEEEKGQVLLNIGNLNDVPLEAVVQIANKLQKKSRQLPKTVAFSRGGGKDLADLLGEMDAEDVKILDELTALNPIYPYWMLQFTAMDRANGDFFL